MICVTRAGSAGTLPETDVRSRGGCSHRRGRRRRDSSGLFVLPRKRKGDRGGDDAESKDSARESGSLPACPAPPSTAEGLADVWGERLPGGGALERLGDLIAHGWSTSDVRMSRSAVTARWVELLTVPTEQPSASAVSASDNCSK